MYSTSICTSYCDAMRIILTGREERVLQVGLYCVFVGVLRFFTFPFKRREALLGLCVRGGSAERRAGGESAFAKLHWPWFCSFSSTFLCNYLWYTPVSWLTEQLWWRYVQKQDLLSGHTLAVCTLLAFYVDLHKHNLECSVGKVLCIGGRV